MSYRFTRFIGIAGAVALAGLAACSDSTSAPSTSDASATSDSAASNSLLSNFFGLGNTVTVTIDSSSVAVGNVAHAVATVRDSKGNVVTASAVTWSSSDAKKATVASNGAVTAVAAGSATITATYQGKSGKTTVTVTAGTSTPTTGGSVATIQVSVASTSLPVGKSAQASYKAMDASGKAMNGMPMSWSSSNAAIATVSTNGMVTAVAPGSAYIIAYSGDKYGYATENVTGSAASAPTQPSTPAAPTAPAAPSAPAQPSQPTGTGNLASANFDDGTYGANILNETPGHNSIVADPSNSGHGKVLQINYSASTGAGADLNQFVSFNPKSGLSAGSSTFFRGQFYFPANTANFTNGDVLRKLTYWRTDRPQNTQCDFVLFMFGNQIGVSVATPSHTTTKYNVFAVQPGQWYTLEIQATMNSKPGSADGITRVWVNGAMVYEKTNESYTTASDPATTRWSWLTAGHQREGSSSGEGAINEYHYWDNIAWGTSRIGN